MGHTGPCLVTQDSAAKFYLIVNGDNFFFSSKLMKIRCLTFAPEFVDTSTYHA